MRNGTPGASAQQRAILTFHGYLNTWLILEGCFSSLFILIGFLFVNLPYMTKAKVKINPPVCALLPKSSKADDMNPAHSKTKDAENKPAGKRCTSSISEPIVNGKEARRTEKARQTAQGCAKNRNKASGRRKGPDGSCKDNCAEKSLSTSDENKTSNSHPILFGVQAAMEEDDEGKGSIPTLGVAERSQSPFLSDHQWNLNSLWELNGNGTHEDLQKEIDELRSENEYLKV